MLLDIALSKILERLLLLQAWKSYKLLSLNKAAL
jgi:hypothetical protein